MTDDKRIQEAPQTLYGVPPKTTWADVVAKGADIESKGPNNGLFGADPDA